MKTLKINFENQKALEHFAAWLSGSGEQDYWEWMEYREKEEEGDITAVDFDYHVAEFLSENTIFTECGRLDREE